MRHLADGNNLALVARRQIPASHPCNYFWVTDTIALDGLIRSDNRGSESVFPLFLTEDQPPLPLLAIGVTWGCRRTGCPCGKRISQRIS